jgi:hypothetical protein
LRTPGAEDERLKVIHEAESKGFIILTLERRRRRQESPDWNRYAIQGGHTMEANKQQRCLL